MSSTANPISQETQAKPDRSRWMLPGLLLAFFLPALLANLAFQQNWFKGGQTNRGILVEPGIQVSLPAETWRILVLPSGPNLLCDTACENALYAAGQIRLTMGREIDRVSVLAPQELSALTQQELSRLLTLAEGKSQLMILDPQGHLVLRYPAQADRQQMLADGRGLRQDLKRLLKYSRAG